MDIIIAMAGLAEAAEALGLLIASALLLVVTGLLGLAWNKRWPLAFVAALVIWLAAGWLLEPWAAFHPPGVQRSSILQMAPSRLAPSSPAGALPACLGRIVTGKDHPRQSAPGFTG